MPLALRIMTLLGTVVAAAGLPLLLAPATVRATFGLRHTPQLVYILRITGTMLASLGVILLMFGAVYWAALG